jgi:FkbM family methyltransferase
MIINKIINVLKLDGKSISDKILVNKAKLLYLLHHFSSKKTGIGMYLTDDVIAKNSYGIFYCRKREEDLHIISEHFENEIIKLFKKLGKNADVIIDVGAHIGKYTILSSKITNGKVISIEASKDNFSILKKNIMLNNAKNVLAFNLAVTNKNEKVKLYKPNTSGHNTLKKTNAPYELIDGVTLDTFLKKLKIEKVDLIKIDVERAETEVIKGFREYLTNQRVSYIIIEIADGNFNKLEKMLNSFGYIIIKKIDDMNCLVKRRLDKEYTDKLNDISLLWTFFVLLGALSVIIFKFLFKKR